MAQRGDDPVHKYRKERSRVKDSDLSPADTDAVLEFLAAFDPEDLSTTYQNEKGETETLSYNSIEAYGRALRLIAKESDRDLLEHDLDSLTDVFNSFLENLGKQTVRQRQAAAIKFYRYHDLDVDPDEIPLTQTENGSKVDDRDMFSKDEIQAIREVCDNARDRCLLELLIYTGQRLRAIQTLRLRDIDLDEAVYYLNTDELGLKGAEKTGGKRPLLGAEKAVRQWIDYHPTGDPDDYLITALPSATNTVGAGEYLSFPAIRSRLKTLVERAEVDKPPNPHNFRHYFVTVCHREYDMAPSTIKFLIGHGQDSTVMETTYQHLSDEDYINAAREQSGAGRAPDEEEGSLTPETCPTCREPLPPNAKACPDCGMIFTPDARAVKDQVEADIDEKKDETESLEAYKLLDKLEKLADENPDLLEQLDNL